MQKLNAIRCLKCGDIIQSRSVHDFNWCSCHTVFVDGGEEYQRVGGVLEMIEFLMPVQDCLAAKIRRVDGDSSGSSTKDQRTSPVLVV